MTIETVFYMEVSVLAFYGTILSLILSALFRSGPVSALEGTVVGIVDGDTYDIQLPRGRERVRCLLIDTPELHHPIRGEEELGEEAREAAESMIGGKSVFLEIPDPPRDRYGRLLGHVLYRDEAGILRLLGAELCRMGLALPLPMGNDLSRLLEVENGVALAASEGRGLWDIGRRRVFSPSQIAWEAVSLRGAFIEVRLTVKSIRQGDVLWTIVPTEGRIRISLRSETAKRLPPGLLSPGNSVSVIGKVTTGRGGVEIEVGSVSQIRHI